MFSAVKLTKHVDVDLYKHSGYGIGFDRKEFFSIFSVLSSPSHIGNERKDILILGRGPTQGLKHTLVAEKLYWINFTEENTKSCLSLHYNETNSYIYLLMVHK